MARTPRPPAPGRALAKGEIPKAPKKPGTDDTSAGSRRDPVKRWWTKIAAANKQYDRWAKEFEVKRLEQYYRGKHWKGLTEEEAAKKYVTNLTFATVETQLPTLMFTKPKVTVEARPDRLEGEGADQTDVAGRATLIQHLLQTQIDSKELNFQYITTLALRGAYTRFGIIEVGYSADFSDNPNAGKPILKGGDSTDAMVDDTGTPIPQPTHVRTKGTERVYLKKIPGNAFRCYPGRELLTQNDWCGYYEWVNVEDVKNTPGYEHVDDLKATGRTPDLEGEGQTPDAQPDRPSDRDRDDHDGQVKIWKLWDLRAKRRLVLADGHKTFLQQKPFTTLPFADLKFFDLEEEYYPLPPIFNWLSAQDDINDACEMAKIHRQRAIRRYLYDGSISKLEFEKLETGGDMVAARVPKIDPMPVQPIPDAELGEGFWRELATSRENFLEITGVSGEARGVTGAPGTTATQANIVNVRQQVRESRARQQVADWLGRICYLMLLTIRESFQESTIVKRTVDPFGSDPALAARTADEWHEVRTEDISDLNVDVTIDIASLSPIAQEADRTNWLQIVLPLLTNPATVALLALSLPLTRKTLSLCNITSDREVREIWRVITTLDAQNKLMTMAAMASKTSAPGMPTPPTGGPGGGNGNGPEPVVPGETAGHPTAAPVAA